MSKVSIIVPAYNAEQYLRQCLDSIVAQTLEDIQILCINDGSKDGTLAIMQEYASRDSRVLVVDKPNAGYGHSMNVGISEASGEYIGIVESDDYVLPDMYKTLYSLAKEHDLDFIKSDFISFMEADGKRIDHDRKLSPNGAFYNRVINPQGKENRPIFRFPMNTWSGIYKKAFLDQHIIRHNETPGASYQDNGFWFQTFCRATRVYFLNKPFYMNRRDNPNSSIYNKEKVYCMSEEYAYIYSFMEREPALKAAFMDVYFLKKFHNYMFTFNRVALEFKLPFIRHFSTEFKASLENGELDRGMFSEQEWKTLQYIIDDPDRYYMERIAGEVQKAKQNGGFHEVTSILQASRIYKAGLIVTFIPRKIRDLLCLMSAKLRESKSL